MKPLAATIAVLLVACGGAWAQPIYRCGAEYSQTPCPGSKVVESSDPRSAAQRAEAVRVAAEDRRRAARLERERRELERASRPAGATGFHGRPPPAEAAASATERQKSKKKSGVKAAKTTDFVAVEPRAPKKATGN